MPRKKKPQLSPEETILRRSMFCVIVVMCLTGVILQVMGTQVPKPTPDLLARSIRQDIYHDYQGLVPRIKTLEDEQTKTGITVVDQATINKSISDIYYYTSRNNSSQARQVLDTLRNNVVAWQDDLTRRVTAAATPPPPPPPAAKGAVVYGTQVPILIYHYMPGDFEAQLKYIQSHGYTTIDLDLLAAGLSHQATLPAKPIVITFDDGFSNQMDAYTLLRKYNMKATYYIIDGGDASHWCIGAGRTNSSCGDSYLTWDQVRQLDQSGLITIASHTVDHSNLPTLSLAQERFEIIEGKHELEAQLGHAVRHFAYPYGAYNATTVQIVKEAGFVTAVSTIPGTAQSLNNLYALYRIRDPYKLP